MVFETKIFGGDLVLQTDSAVTDDTPTQDIRDTAQSAQATEHVEQTVAQLIQPTEHTEHGDAQ